MTNLLARRRSIRSRSTDGFSLIELLVSMSIFTVLLAVMMSVVVGMNNSMNKTQSIADASAQGLRATQALDKQLRYADDLNPQPPAGTSSSPASSISFEGLTNTGVAQCYQWRVSAGTLQQRTWVSSSTTSANPTLTSPVWTTVATGMVNSAPFVVTSPPAPAAGVTGFMQVAVDLVMVGKGQKVGHAETKMVITARNSNYPPGSQQCTNAVTP
jgi:prepilin-type N-terminal cleavage/methylation domain-containing protein